MKKLFTIFSLILVVTLALSNLACRKSQIASFSYFNTDIRIEAHDKNISSTTIDQLDELFSSIEKQFDVNDKSSIIYAFNNADANAKITLTQYDSELMCLAKEYYEFSDGNFNPAIFPLVKLWQFDSYSSVVSFRPPTDEQIQTALKTVDFNLINIAQDSLTKSSPEIKIDLGGLAKGYALDKALKIMTDAGHEKGYINIGNSSIALLNVKELNVSHPRQKGQNILTISTPNLFDVTLSTSGDYERYFEYQGKKYSHIIDPKTGYPIQTGVASATVIGGTGAFSDAITTALCVSSHNPNDFNSSELVKLMQKIIAEYPDAILFVVYEKDDIKQILTNEKQGDFTLLDDEYQIKNI